MGTDDVINVSADELQDSYNVRIAIVAAKYHREITDRMVEDARTTLRDHCVGLIETVRVPGVYEIPLTASWLLGAESDLYDAVVALGCVIRGETEHFNQIVTSCTRGIETISLKTGIPIANGILAVDSKAQAEERCSDDRNRAVEAARAALEQVHLRRELIAAGLS